MIVLTPTPNSANGQQAVDISMMQGEVMGLSFDIAIDGVPLDLTGATAKFVIQMPSTFEATVTIPLPKTGRVFANATSEQTSSFPPGTYFYELWVEQQLSPPVELQYLTGTFTVNESIAGFP